MRTLIITNEVDKIENQDKFELRELESESSLITTSDVFAKAPPQANTACRNRMR